MPLAVPSAPTGVQAVAGDTQTTVTWTPPSNTGGSAITRYAANAYLQNGTYSGRQCQTSSGTTCTLTGLTNGTTYLIRAYAQNAQGWSQASTNTTVTPTVP